MVGMDIAWRCPALHLHPLHAARSHQAIQVGIFQARLDAKVVIHPTRLCDAQGLD